MKNLLWLMCLCSFGPLYSMSLEEHKKLNATTDFLAVIQQKASHITSGHQGLPEVDSVDDLVSTVVIDLDTEMIANDKTESPRLFNSHLQCFLEAMKKANITFGVTSQRRKYTYILTNFRSQFSLKQVTEIYGSLRYVERVREPMEMVVVKTLQDPNPSIPIQITNKEVIWREVDQFNMEEQNN